MKLPQKGKERIAALILIAEHRAFENLIREYFRSGFGYFQPMAFRSERLIQDLELEFGGAHGE